MKSLQMTAALLTGNLLLIGAIGFAQGRGGGGNAAPPAANAAGGRGGPGQVQTEQEKKNIAVVMGFWKNIWESRDPKAVPRYMSPTYMEHNNNAVNGLANWTRDRPLPPPDQRVRIASQKVYARSDFVLLLQDRDGPDPADPSKRRKINMIEMFRVYDNLLQEHWMFFPADSPA